MIDLHSHILPGMDDGPKTIEESLQMCRAYWGDGVRTVVATPHTLNSVYLNEHVAILSKVRELNEAIAECGLVGTTGCTGGDDGTPLSEFRVLPGADVHFSEDILYHLGRGEITTLGGCGSFLMIEFPSYGIPYRAEEILFQIISREIIPLISHPERNLEISQTPQRYYRMIRMGCLGQVTGMSLTGEFGPEIRKTAERLMESHLVHCSATDAHSPNGRSPILSRAVKAAEKIIGKEEARRMVTRYPQAMLEGKRPDGPEPLSP